MAMRCKWSNADDMRCIANQHHTNRIPPTIAVRRWRQKVSGVVTPSPVGPAIENDGTPSPPRPRPAVLGPLITKIVQSMILPIFDITVVSREWRIGGVAEAVLALLGQRDRPVDVRDADERDERHHLLVLDERMLGAGLAEEELRARGDLDARRARRARPGPGRSGPC